jgi:hypothetical protein
MLLFPLPQIITTNSQSASGSFQLMFQADISFSSRTEKTPYGTSHMRSLWINSCKAKLTIFRSTSDMTKTSCLERADYPELRQMTFDFLSVPAMSSETKRVFSQARHTIPDTRCRLGAAIIEATECDRPWMRAGLGTISRSV